MARGVFLGKSRNAQTTAGGISNPILKYTDAIPRANLRDVENITTTPRPVNRAVAQWDFQRPRTADARKQIRKGPSPIPFDFQVPMSCDEALSSPQTSEPDLNANMIGIALGSPRMVEPQGMLQIQDQHPVSNAASSDQILPLKRKASKWRKIGGFFRAKNAMTSDVNQPFYQVRSGEEWPLQESTHSIDYENEERVRLAPSKPSHTEVWPCLESENDYTKGRKNAPQLSTAAPDLVENYPLVPTAKLRCAGPLLHVDIPDVQLERYSVMFGGLLNKSEPSLLNRRSKTLEDITIPTRTEVSPLSSPDLPLPRRRATSPRPRLPSFNLFPAQTPASKASKVLGSQNIPRSLSPVHQSQNSLSRSSSITPTKESSRFFFTIQSPSLKSPMSHQHHDSVSSAISSASIDLAEEKRLLERIKQTKAYVNIEEEPEWEIINKNPTKEISPSASTPTATLPPISISAPRQRSPLALTINTQDLPSDPAKVDPSSASDSASSSPLLSPLSSASGERTDLSPVPLSAISQASSTRMPLSGDTDDKETETIERINSIPRIEVSIARSVSVSRGKRQVLVPIGPRVDRLNADERLVVRRAQTPQVRDVQYGHRHGNSQDVQIESI